MRLLIPLLFGALLYFVKTQTLGEYECPEYTKDSDVVYYPHEECANQFYVCNHQDLLLMSCGDVLVYDPKWKKRRNYKESDESTNEELEDPPLIDTSDDIDFESFENEDIDTEVAETINNRYEADEMNDSEVDNENKPPNEIKMHQMQQTGSTEVTVQQKEETLQRECSSPQPSPSRRQLGDVEESNEEYNVTPGKLPQKVSPVPQLQFTKRS
ncbi:hypothetical protein RN001_007105 [Aquatica leii]|uniref:Chitin-binding type-2 domain-containing protein n=1 Tax=Aquatica leii TaxID=1421715 RepID=A0AAN7PW02_9COLE|nr:hypothetical protein RN001_007105 [Aquatica leii]